MGHQFADNFPNALAVKLLFQVCTIYIAAVELYAYRERGL